MSAVSEPARPVVIEGRSLSKRYGGRDAVVDLDLSVCAGEICALLGPNGAGKTSAIRMLLGLSRPDSGCARMLGEPVRLGSPTLARVGVMIDGPAFAPHLSGEENLRMLWRAGGRPWPPPALSDALRLAGLGDALAGKVRRYSMGMKQRLMLAQALMRDPQVLVLDEPANGLDPREVHSLREQLRTMADRGVAVLISSHQLAEIEQVATDVIVLDRGRCAATGPLAQLLAQRNASSLEDAFLRITEGGSDADR